MKSILVIERDGPLQKSLKRLFSSTEEYEVDVVADGTAGLENLRQRTQVAVILDIERPVNSEVIFVRKLRYRFLIRSSQFLVRAPMPQTRSF
jgi:DNA-binding response OmpR family regulator